MHNSLLQQQVATRLFVIQQIGLVAPRAACEFPRELRQTTTASGPIMRRVSLEFFLNTNETSHHHHHLSSEPASPGPAVGRRRIGVARNEYVAPHRPTPSGATAASSSSGNRLLGPLGPTSISRQSHDQLDELELLQQVAAEMSSPGGCTPTRLPAPALGEQPEEPLGSGATLESATMLSLANLLSLSP